MVSRLILALRSWFSMSVTSDAVKVELTDRMARQSRRLDRMSAPVVRESYRIYGEHVDRRKTPR